MPRLHYFSLRFLLILNLIFVIHYLAGLTRTLDSLNGEPAFEIVELVESNRTVRRPLPRGREWPTSDFFVQRGDYWVGYDKVPAVESFFGNDSITLTTPSDHTNLDNLVPLVKLWQGPISCSLFAPGTDYLEALRVIRYLRECTTPLIKKYVSFHLFFHKDHIPDKVYEITAQKFKSEPGNCEDRPEFDEGAETYRREHGLVYPINVARNVARESATTHFVFASDIELYPTPNVIPQFMEMLQRGGNSKLTNETPKVFVLPVFEVEQNVTELPRNRRELKNLLDAKRAIPFHKYICAKCHNIPGITRWVKAKDRAELGIFKTVKRRGSTWAWEPFYIGTKKEPVFDERVTWEGRSNKRVQAFSMCLIDYDYHVLNNVFLVHRPGIKYESHSNQTLVDEMNELLDTSIVPELKLLHGDRKGCRI